MYDLRKNGITTFHGGKIYHKLKHKRLIKVKSRKEQYENLIDWKTLGPCIERFGTDSFVPHNTFNFIQKRKKAAPLDIIGMFKNILFLSLFFFFFFIFVLNIYLPLLLYRNAWL